MNIRQLRPSDFFERTSFHLLRVVVLLAILGSEPSLSQTDPSSSLRAEIPEITSCRQLVTVTTTSWEGRDATVRLYERTGEPGSNWRRVGNPFAAVVGRRGLAWGIGLHDSGEAGQPCKREGDNKAPAGVFRFGEAFGRARPEQVRFLRLPYRQVTPDIEAVDDPRSKYYNQIVDRRTVRNPYWASAELMFQVGERYRLGVIIEHNVEAYRGLGSCIFFHVWDSRDPGTTGCTAADYSHLVRLLRWIDSRKNPLIVQLPTGEYKRLMKRWALPALRE